MALSEPTSRAIQAAEEVAWRADTYRTAITLLRGAELLGESEPEDALRLARFLLREATE